jgi:hypothetical protein
MINNNCSKWVFRSKDLDQLDKVRRVGDLGDTIPRVIKKKPTKAQIKIYFLNIFKTKVFKRDIYDSPINGNLNKFVNDLWYQNIKGVPFSKHEVAMVRFLSILTNFKFNKIEKLLRDYDLYPEYLYGLEKNGEFYFFNYMCTNIDYVSFKDDMFHFHCFNSDLSIMYNSKYFEGTWLSAEMYLTNSGQVVARRLGEKRFVLMDKDFRIVKKEAIIEDYFGLIPLGISRLENHPNCDKYAVIEVDISTQTFDSKVVFTLIEL